MNIKVNHKPLITIVGPTASGKTDLAIKIAKKFNGVVISADSRQIYKNIPIGTNQPAGKIGRFLGEPVLYVKKIPHFFIGIFNLNKKFNVALYQKSVYKLLPKIWAKGLVPIICGGTGLYISAVIQNYQFSKNKSALKQGKALDSLILGLNPDRKKNYSIINKRVDIMVKQGLLNEVRWLQKNYPQSPALATIGYREFLNLKSPAEIAHAIEKVKQHSRNFAKRQMTWFRKMPEIHWVKPTSTDKLVKDYLKPQSHN